MVSSILESGIGVKAKGRGIIEAPMGSQLDQHAEGELVHERVGLLAGLSLEAVAVGELVEEMWVEMDHAPLQQPLAGGE